jgi:transposase-like protein
MRNLEIGSYRTAWFMAHRIRWALTQEPIKEALDGIVEVDETYVGGKFRTGSQSVKPGERPKDRPAGTANKKAVVAVLQRGGPVRSHHVEHVTAKDLKPIVKAMVKEDAHLMTDSSNVLASAGIGLKHDQVNHSAGEYARRENGTLISTNSVESYFAILKRGHYGVYHHWSKKHLGQYLREFDWRYNVRGLPDVERVVVALKMTTGKRMMLKSARKSE